MPATPKGPALPEESPLSPEQLESELNKFEGYRERLSADIERLEARRARLQEDIDEYGTLVRNVEKLIVDNTSTFVSRVDLGCDVTCAARVPDTRTIYVAVGLGFHVGVTLGEVAGLVAPRQKHLEGQLAEVEKQLLDARACALAFDSSLKLLRREGAA